MYQSSYTYKHVKWTLKGELEKRIGIIFNDHMSIISVQIGRGERERQRRGKRETEERG